MEPKADIHKQLRHVRSVGSHMGHERCGRNIRKESLSLRWSPFNIHFSLAVKIAAQVHLDFHLGLFRALNQLDIILKFEVVRDLIVNLRTFTRRSIAAVAHPQATRLFNLNFCPS